MIGSTGAVAGGWFDRATPPGLSTAGLGEPSMLRFKKVSSPLFLFGMGVVDWPGFEPGTSSVQDSRSTTDLPALLSIFVGFLLSLKRFGGWWSGGLGGCLFFAVFFLGGLFGWFGRGKLKWLWSVKGLERR